jgi:hypothetical protein
LPSTSTFDDGNGAAAVYADTGTREFDTAPTATGRLRRDR